MSRCTDEGSGGGSEEDETDAAESCETAESDLWDLVDDDHADGCLYWLDRRRGLASSSLAWLLLRRRCGERSDTAPGEEGSFGDRE